MNKKMRKSEIKDRTFEISQSNIKEKGRMKEPGLLCVVCFVFRWGLTTQPWQPGTYRALPVWASEIKGESGSYCAVTILPHPH